MKGGSLSDVGTGVGVLCRPGGQGKRVAKIAAFLVESRFRSRLASPGTGWDWKIMPERRHSCSRLTLTLFFSLSDTQTTTPVCHYGPIPDGPPPKGRIERIGPVVTLICCCGIPGPQPWVPRASDAEDRESTDVSSTVNVKFPAQAR